MRLTLSTLMCTVLFVGCGPATEIGELDALTEDENRNGFVDVPPPDGVPFDEATNINIALNNQIENGDLSAYAEDAGVDAALLGLATIEVFFTFNLDYGNGITDSISDSELLRPFELAFEVACPQSTTLQASVDVRAPFVGSIATFEVVNEEVPVDDCGVTIEVNTFINDSGDIDQTITVN